MYGEEDQLENVRNTKDLTQSPNPVYYNEQIDQMILTPEARSNLITKKKPRYIKKPVYLFDDNGDKVPFKNDKGDIKINDLGEVQYVIKDYKYVQVGWKSVLEVVPASEIFNIDNATSNISGAAVNLLTRLYWLYNFICVYQQSTENDYSLYLHKIRNDALAILSSAKSYNGGTVQAIKTFINKVDNKQWLEDKEEDKKKDNPLGWLVGGNKKKADRPEKNNKYTGFQNDNYGGL